MKRSACCFLVLVACNTASASDSLRTDYYRVDGNSVRSIRDALDRHGPVGADGKRYHGNTSWHVSWNFTYAPAGSACVIRSVRVDTDTVMTLPQLAGTGTLPASVRVKRETYSAALRLHEDGHRRIAISAAREVERRLSRLGSSGGCKALESEANRVAQAILSDFRARERDYDRSTDHGASQGARF